MNHNIRLFVRLFQDNLMKDNPIIQLCIRLKGILSNYAELPTKSQKISKDLKSEKSKLIKAQNIVTINSGKNINSNINLIR